MLLRLSAHIIGHIVILLNDDVRDIMALKRVCRKLKTIIESFNVFWYGRVLRNEYGSVSCRKKWAIFLHLEQAYIFPFIECLVPEKCPPGFDEALFANLQKSIDLDHLLETTFSKEREEWGEEDERIEHARVKLLEHFFGRIDCQRNSHFSRIPIPFEVFQNVQDVYFLHEFFQPHYRPDVCFFHEYILQQKERAFARRFNRWLGDIDKVEAEMKQKLEELQKFR